MTPAREAPAGHAVVWEYRVEAAGVPAFERAYGPGGDWARLFAGGRGYLGTELWRDDGAPGRYLVVDRWRSAGEHRAFMREAAAAYEALGRRLDGLFAEERRLGAFRAVRPAL